MQSAWRERHMKGTPHEGYATRGVRHKGCTPHGGYVTRGVRHKGCTPHGGYATFYIIWRIHIDASWEGMYIPCRLHGRRQRNLHRQFFKLEERHHLPKACHRKKRRGGQGTGACHKKNTNEPARKDRNVRSPHHRPPSLQHVHGQAPKLTSGSKGRPGCASKSFLK